MTSPDHVTGLAPRGELQRTLAALLDDHASRPLAVVMCDVVGLKEVNDRGGFLAGDAALAAAAAALRAAATDATLVGRLGGDELVAIFHGPAAAASAHRTALAVCEAQEPRMRAAAAIAEPHDTPGAVIDRLYATMRAS